MAQTIETIENHADARRITTTEVILSIRQADIRVQVANALKAKLVKAPVVKDVTVDLGRQNKKSDGTSPIGIQQRAVQITDGEFGEYNTAVTTIEASMGIINVQDPTLTSLRFFNKPTLDDLEKALLSDEIIKVVDDVVLIFDHAAPGDIT